MGRHLTYTNRLQIEAWLKAGVKVKEMAEMLGMLPCNRIRRNKTRYIYTLKQ